MEFNQKNMLKVTLASAVLIPIFALIVTPDMFPAMLLGALVVGSFFVFKYKDSK